tara:strand:+ start:15 stop:596 length:582 start_codon:yes stop_codon:yes gene_type:complete
MKEHKFPDQSFIRGYYINPKICDDIIKCFNELPDAYRKPGKMYNTNSKTVIDPESKDSIDFMINKGTGLSPFLEYDDALQNCLEKYVQEYPDLNYHAKFNVVEPMNVQFYKPGGGFKVWHYERQNSLSINRVLVFMTYLNDVADGGTEFKYQKLTCPAKKGLTIIWPSDWHHTHKGQISKKEKYIITGWYSLV